MRKEYDLHGAKRGAVVKDTGKQRITIMLDGDVLSAFRNRAAGTGRGYQTLINQALRDYLANGELEDRLPASYIKFRPMPAFTAQNTEFSGRSSV